MAVSILVSVLVSRRKNPPRRKRQHPLAWIIFEVFIISMTAVDSVLSTLRWNALFPIVNLQGAEQFIQSLPWLDQLIGNLVNFNIIILAGYIALKIPIATATAVDYFKRVYILGRRVHESAIGIAWILIAAVLIIYGQDFDRWLGIFYIQFGMFLVGKDYLDVNKLVFLRDLRRQKGDDDKENAVNGQLPAREGSDSTEPLHRKKK
jgi:fumarate reductase subunit D